MKPVKSVRTSTKLRPPCNLPIVVGHRCPVLLNLCHLAILMWLACTVVLLFGAFEGDRTDVAAPEQSLPLEQPLAQTPVSELP